MGDKYPMVKRVSPLSLRFQILERDGFRCRYCGSGPQDGAVLQVDHTTPVKELRGQPILKGELITACRDCNLGKTDKLLEEKSKGVLRLVAS